MDEQTILALWRSEGKRHIKRCAKALNDYHAAEDIVIDAFTDLVKKDNVYNPPGMLTTIVNRKLGNEYRRRDKVQPVGLVPSDADGYDHIPRVTSQLPFTGSLIRSTLTAMPDRDAARAWYLTEVVGLTQEEAGRHEGVVARTISARAEVAAEALRNALETS